MEKKKLLYSLMAAAGFAAAFVGLRIVKNALLGIAGILVCIYGLIEATHYFTASPSKNGNSMYSPFPPENTTVACPHCGADVPADNEFCGKCGNKITL